MKEIVEGGVPALKHPFSWAVNASGFLFMAHGPVRTGGTINRRVRGNWQALHVVRIG